MCPRSSHGRGELCDRLPGVAALRPCNAHPTAGVGALFPVSALLFAWAAWRPQRALVVPLAVAWSLFATPHLVFHVRHLDGFAAGDAVARTASLALVLAAAVAPAGLRRAPA